ncbi:PEPxxWA-CTERM sorting domain-containing protein [Phenylobacterium sp.]|uniref:PEPxxWA-CTERM sorting domain-containing protein n=1 Tax=Phenylobacterium sp. TaxID=1871053 RepID=UPI0025E7A246|nr:PEPxxWA-CTERM sorting domain-containing protein [Phenylobacterium sp.]
MKLAVLPLVAAPFAAALLAAAPANAILCNLFTEFGDPAAHFSWGGYLDGAFTPFTDASGCVIAGTSCLHADSEPPLGVYKTLGGAFKAGTVLVPAGALIFHPGPLSRAAVLFTAPQAGRYTFTGSAFVADTDPSGTFIIGLLHPGGANFTEFNLGKLDALDPALGFNLTATLKKGDSYGLAVDNAGSYFNDSTGLKLLVSHAPEPAGWALLIAGFGLTGAAIRRRAALSTL